jgi:integrase/recombinase XerC
MKNSVDNTSMSDIESLIQQFQAYLVGVGKSDHTVKAYSHDVASFGQWWEQSTGRAFQPQVVVSPDIVEYRGYLQRQGRKPATINRRLNALRKFFLWAKREQLATDTPFDILENVFVKVQQDVSPGWLDPNEQLTLVRAVRDKGNRRDLTIIQTFLNTGLRLSELAVLKVSDIEISERRGTLFVRSGKGIKQREIPLNKQARAALSAYLEEREQIEVDDLDEEERERVFFGQRGPLTERGLDQLVAKYAYQARLENCTAHTLRHSFAKNLVNAGTSLDEVASLLGHESLDTTRVYTRPSRQDLERSVRRAAGELD